MKKIYLSLLLLSFIFSFSCGKEEVTSESSETPPPIKPLIYANYTAPDIEFYTDAEKLKSEFDTEFKKIKDGFDAIDALSYDERTVDNTLLRMDSLFAQLDFPKIMLLAYVSPDEALREASNDCEKQVSEYLSSFTLRKGTYNALVDLRKKFEGQFKPDEKRWIDEAIKDFEMQGVQLEGEKRERLKEINSQLSKLSIDFSKNIRDEDSSIVMTADELKGIPETALERFERDKKGSYIIRPDYPARASIMKYAEISDTRKKFNELFLNRAYPENIEILKKNLALKKEKAGILGYSAIRELLLADKMAKKPETVDAFLKNLWETISTKTAADRETLKLAYDRKEVNYSDIEFLKNKIKQEKYSVDEEKIREYFSLESTLKGCMEIYEQLFSIKFVEDSSAYRWHPDVKKYLVMSEGKVIAGIYLDLFPRDNKYSHAAQFGLRSGRLISPDHYEAPVIALVCNFVKPTEDKPSLLSLDEVETFFHEFGHGMHSCLTTARLAGQSGTSVKRDFVEAPSQMFELWLEKPEILNRFARHYKTGEPMPEELIKNIVKLNYFFKAFDTTRQIFYAMFDQAIHGSEIPESTTDLWADMMLDITKYKSPENTHFEASFGHIVSGYSAGYYSYLWSEVISVDTFSRFEKEGLMNPELGMEYRVKVLSKGDSKDPEELVIDFLGRKSNSEAFLQILQKDI